MTNEEKEEQRLTNTVSMHLSDRQLTDKYSYGLAKKNATHTFT